MYTTENAFWILFSMSVVSFGLVIFMGVVDVYHSEKEELKRRIPLVINTWPFTNATAKGKIISK